MVVWASAMPRSAIIWTRSRELELKGQVPSHAQHDDLVIELPSLKEILCRRRFDHAGHYRRKPSFSSLHQNLMELVKFPQRYQNSPRTVIAGIMGRPIDADALDSRRIRRFHRIPGELQLDFQTLLALTAGDQWALCIRDAVCCGPLWASTIFRRSGCRIRPGLSARNWPTK